MLFVSLAMMGSVVGLVLNIVDYQNGSILNGSKHRASRVKLSSMSEEGSTDSESLLAAEY
jgi:hypothetical protein